MKIKVNLNLDISPPFQYALRLMEEGKKNLFITGKAGTGKSTLLDYFCSSREKKPVVLAPTGVAALNVKGLTIHSFFNFYIDVTPEKIKKQKKTPKNSEIYKKLKTLIIDEISNGTSRSSGLCRYFSAASWSKKRQGFWRRADDFCG